MAYQARRSKIFEEEFELIDENDNVKRTLHVKLDADSMVGKINRKYLELVKTYNEVMEIKRNSKSNEELAKHVEKLGNAVVTMFEAVFGEEDTKTIIEFYDGRYIEMCKEITPFITGVVIPKCTEIKKGNQKILQQKYNRKQRRLLGLK